MNEDPSSPSRQMTALSTTPPSPTLVDRLFGWMRSSSTADLRTGMEDALASEPNADGDFSLKERSMLRNILRLHQTRTEDVMVQRGDIIAVDQATSLAEVLAKLRSSGHSRMPVFDDSLDHPIGMVHIKDVVSYLIDRAQLEAGTPRERVRSRKAAGQGETAASSVKTAGFDLRQIDLEALLKDVAITRPLLFVPASMSATDLMAQMQANRVQMALVIDEYGGTDGLVSLEDLIETVVGDIEDEHDDEVAPTLDALGDGGFVANARVPLEDIQETFGDTVVFDSDDAEEVDTLGGLVFAALGRIPVRGELIDAVEGLDIEVTDADPRRIKQLKVYPAGLRRRDPRMRKTGRAGAIEADAKVEGINVEDAETTHDASAA